LACAKQLPPARDYCYHRDSKEIAMGQIIVRNLDDHVIARLKARAAKANQSLEQTVRDILSAAAKPSKEEVWQEIDELRAQIATRQGNVVLDPTELIREDRDK
jgi:plasmid stability protein